MKKTEDLTSCFLKLVPVAALILLLSGCELPNILGSQNSAPDFELPVYSNAGFSSNYNIRLSDMEDSPVVLNFWFPSCPPCRAEIPDIEASFKRYQNEGVYFLGITNLELDSKKDALDFISETGATYTFGIDVGGSIMRSYGVNGFPSTIFMNSEHEIVRSWVGMLDSEKLEEFIQEIVN